MHDTIVIAVIILGKRRVKPSAVLAKLFDVTPKRTANTVSYTHLTLPTKA